MELIALTSIAAKPTVKALLFCELRVIFISFFITLLPQSQVVRQELESYLIVRSMLFNLKCVVFAAAVIIRSDKPLDAAILLFGEHLIAVDYVV